MKFEHVISSEWPSSLHIDIVYMYTHIHGAWLCQGTFFICLSLSLSLSLSPSLYTVYLPLSCVLNRAVLLLLSATTTSHRYDNSHFCCHIRPITASTCPNYYPLSWGPIRLQGDPWGPIGPQGRDGLFFIIGLTKDFFTIGLTMDFFIICDILTITPCVSHGDLALESHSQNVSPSDVRANPHPESVSLTRTEAKSLASK